MSSNMTYMSPFSGTKRRRPENEPEDQVCQQYESFIGDHDYRLEINRFKADAEIRHLRQQLSATEEKLTKQAADNKDLLEKLNDLEDKIKTKDCVEDQLKKECREKTTELKKLSHNYREYSRTMTHNMDELRKEMDKALKSADEEFKDIVTEKENLIQSQRNRIKALIRKQESTEEQLKKTIDERKKIIAQKNLAIDSLANSKQAVQTRVEEEITKVNKYKAKYESCRIDLEKCEKAYKCLKNETNCGDNCQKLKDHIKYLETECGKLRQQRQYFNSQNEMNKKKSVSNAIYSIDLHTLYANELRQNGKNIIDVNMNLLEKVRKFFEEVMEESKSEGYQQLANTIENINEKMDSIIAKKDKIEEKRSDGKINCGDCPKTFETMSALKHHYTVTHKKDTTNPSKNQIEILEIDLTLD